MSKRFAIISSSGGSAFLAAHEALRGHEFRVLTDRACGMETGCRERQISVARIEDPDNRGFSEKAAKDLEDHGPFDAVVLFHTRLVTEPLISKFRMINIHPALLPAFKGFNGLRQTVKGGAKFFGATAHRVSPGVDDGPIIAQVCQPLAPGLSMRDLEKASYLHKVYLMLLLVDLVETGDLMFTKDGVKVSKTREARSYANPALANSAYDKYFRKLQASEGVSFA